MEPLIEQMLAYDALDWSVTVAALIYVFLAARNNPLGWVFGAFACAGWAYIDIVRYQLYSDAILQSFYVIMAIVGIYQWQKGGADGMELPITRMRRTDHLIVISVSTICGLLLGAFVGANFPAAATYPDAITTTFSVAATILLLRRKLENWLYWIVVDTAYCFIYESREAWLLLCIMIVYIAAAIYGYRKWKVESPVI